FSFAKSQHRIRASKRPARLHEATALRPRIGLREHNVRKANVVVVAAKGRDSHSPDSNSRGSSKRKVGQTARRNRPNGLPRPGLSGAGVSSSQARLSRHLSLKSKSPMALRRKQTVRTPAPPLPHAAAVAVGVDDAVVAVRVVLSNSTE